MKTDLIVFSNTASVYGAKKLQSLYVAGNA